MKQIQKIKLCPICGSAPLLNKKSLDYGNGHGYPGNYMIEPECPVCELPHPDAVDDIYEPAETLVARAIESWNKEVDRIQSLLDQRDK